MGLTTSSVLRSIQEVREMVELAPNPLEKASKIIYDIIGITHKFDDQKTALHVTQAIVKTYIENDSYDEELALSEAIGKATRIRAEDPWMFAVSTTPLARGETVSAIIEGIDVQVAVKGGKIKKGGKLILATALFKKHITDVEVPITNKEFVQMLIKQLGMSLAGANTYSWTLRKAAGLIVSK